MYVGKKEKAKFRIKIKNNNMNSSSGVRARQPNLRASEPNKPRGL